MHITFYLLFLTSAVSLRLRSYEERTPTPCNYTESAHCQGGACYISNDVRACTEPVPACKPNIHYIGKLALLASNTHYRIGDIVKRAGYNWRSSSLAMLSSPMFRGTMMRDALLSVITLNGEKLNNITDDGLEEKMQLHSKNEGGEQLFCNLQTKSKGALSIAKSLMPAMIHWTEQQHALGNCDAAKSSELVVQIRLGDVSESVATVIGMVDETLKKKSSFKSIIFSGVLHFSGYMGSIDGRVHKKDHRVKKSLHLIHQLEAYYAKKGYQSRVRSQPLADDDLCYLAHVPNLLQSCAHKGWCGIIQQLRKGVQSARYYENHMGDYIEFVSPLPIAKP